MAADRPSAWRSDTGQVRVPRPIVVAVLSWLAMIGVDLFLHAGVLAPLYDWGSPFLLRPEEAFLRIPVGYSAFLLLAVALVWLLPRLGVRRASEGAVYAAGTSAVVWGAMVLGLWSIATADPALLAAWWVGQTAELALGGYIVGAALAGARVRALAVLAVVVLAVGATSAVVLQSIGYVESVPATID
ncbi:MAG TPA: hypothetical protein VFH90_05575 [Candidatus Limnocylindria bacterium]|nr:hypothetical protein [Candidatus Limnocylindria bacterium]